MIDADKIKPDIKSVEGGREVTFAASSDVQLHRNGWFGSYLEKLVHTDDAVDASFIRQGDAPILYDHCRRISDIAGKINGYEIRNGRLYVRAFFADDIPEQKDAADRIAAGAITAVSVGWDYNPADVDVRDWEHMTTAEKDTGAEYAVDYRKWKPMEVSLVSIPADDTVGMGRGMELKSYTRDKDITSLARERLAMRSEERDNNNKKRSGTMNDEDKKAKAKMAETDDTETENEEDVEATSKEADDTSDDKEDARKRGWAVIDEHKELLGEHFADVRKRAIGEGWTATKARAVVLDTMKAMTQGVPARTGALTPEKVAIHLDKGQNDFSIARYAREALSGKLKSGLGTLEAEMHTDAERARTGPALLANEFALPARFLFSDKRFVSAAMRKSGQRAIELGDAGGTDGASAYAKRGV